MIIKKNNKNKKDIRVILHDIRSTHNVGSIFRTADGCGVSRIYISGYTPAPKDHFGRVQKDIAKTALGAEDSVDWEEIQEISKLITKLKKEGFIVVALEQDPRSVNYKKVTLKEKTVVLVGNEVSGVDPVLLKKCDIIAEIPMFGAKESLNVSVAFGVALFRFIG